MRDQGEKLGKTPAEVAALEKYGKDRLQTGITFFLQKFNVQFGNVVCAFKAMRLTCPNAIQNLKPDPAAIEQLHLFLFLGVDETISALQEELPAYVAAAVGTEVKDGEHLQWWHRHKSCLPNWSEAVKQLVLVQPSSAPAERASSILPAAIDE